MYDLSKIDKPFGELTPPVQKALKEYARSGGKMQYRFNSQHWATVDLPSWVYDFVYRADPDHYTAEKWQLGMPAAHRIDPYTEVELWEPETRAGMDCPIISASNCGGVVSHRKDGRQCVNTSEPQPYDLVPLQTKPARKPSVDWDDVGPKINHIARDAGGSVWGFSEMPFVDDGYSQWDAYGEAWDLTNILASYDPGDVPWQDSLISRPGHEGDE